MTQPTNTLVAAADYADALIVARRVKTTLCTLLFFVLGATLTLFALLRYVPKLQPLAGPGPFDTATVNSRLVLQYFVGMLDLAGLILPLLLVAYVAVILLVQVVARIAGVGRTTGAFGWAVLLAILLFPWQAVLNNPVNSAETTAALGMKLPGVVYTWAEVSHPTQGARFVEVNQPDADKLAAGLHWARYALFPVLAMVIVGIVHTKTERGLRQSFGTDIVGPADGDAAVVDTGSTATL